MKKTLTAAAIILASTVSGYGSADVPVPTPNPIRGSDPSVMERGWGRYDIQSLCFPVTEMSERYEDKGYKLQWGGIGSERGQLVFIYANETTADWVMIVHDVRNQGTCRVLEGTMGAGTGFVPVPFRD